MLVLLSLLTACSAVPSMDTAEESQVALTTLATERQLIRSATLEIEVKSATTTASALEDIINTSGGYIDNIYERNQIRILITAKVPAMKLDQFMVDVASQGKLVSKSMVVQDVTEQMVDVASRIKNLQVLRDRFRKVLDMANNVNEILAIESELSKVQSELDSMIARSRSLKGSVALSKVDIVISQQRTYGPIGYVLMGFSWVIEKMFIIK